MLSAQELLGRTLAVNTVPTVTAWTGNAELGIRARTIRKPPSTTLQAGVAIHASKLRSMLV
jgi:hypothetical protein